MKVLLDIGAVRFPLTGVGRYTFELARHLPLLNDELDLEFILGSQRGVELPSIESTSTDLAQEASRPSLGLLLRELGSRAPLLARVHRAAFLKRQQWSLRGAQGIYHGPHFWLPRLDVPSVVTIHDLSVYDWAECQPSGRVAALRKSIEFAVSHATQLITVSSFVRDELTRVFAVPKHRISVVPLASGPEFRPRTQAECAGLLKQYELGYRAYTLYSGTIEPRKNLDRLLDAYNMLPMSVRTRYPLVLCGYRGWKSAEIHERLSKAQAEGWARYLGYVPHHHLPVLFSGARLFVFPSLYEGFGLPVLEAMASKTPVVCSSEASLPEVVGQTALMCPATDTERLAAHIAQGIEDREWQASARLEGYERSRLFSWRSCAELTACVYRRAAQCG